MTLLPEEAFLWLWLVLSVVAAIVVVRALRLPVIWVVYPPLLYGVIAANPHVVVLALLVVAGTWGGALASVIKIVAVPPLLGERRWRALLLAAAAIGASVVLFPGTWSSFLHQVGTVQDTINAESGGGLSAWGKPYLFIPTVLSLAFWRCSTGVPPAGWSCRLCFRLRSTTTRCSPFRSTRSSPPSWPFQWPGWPARDHRLHGYPNLPRRVAPLWACAPAWPRGSRPLRRWRIDRRSPPRFPQHRAA